MSRLKSFYYAFRGLYTVWRSEPNMRIHLLAAAAVIATECFNTGLEHLTDLVSPGHHPLAGKAKDAAAAAVLVAAMAAVAVACCIFLPRIVRLLNT